MGTSQQEQSIFPQTTHESLFEGRFQVRAGGRRLLAEQSLKRSVLPQCTEWGHIRDSLRRMGTHKKSEAWAAQKNHWKRKVMPAGVTIGKLQGHLKDKLRRQTVTDLNKNIDNRNPMLYMTKSSSLSNSWRCYGVKSLVSFEAHLFKKVKKNSKKKVKWPQVGESYRKYISFSFSTAVTSIFCAWLPAIMER